MNSNWTHLQLNMTCELSPMECGHLGTACELADFFKNIRVFLVLWCTCAGAQVHSRVTGARLLFVLPASARICVVAVSR